MFETYSIYTYLFFIGGFLFLIKGADFLINGSVNIAKRFGLSEHFIGLTIVSFGTSLPEFVVSFVASMKGNNAIALGNVLGSNIANTLLITGCIAIITVIVVKKQTIYREIPFSVLIIGLLALLAKTDLFTNKVNQIDFVEGIVLLTLFFFFIRYTFQKSKFDKDEIQSPKLSTGVSIIVILLGITGLFFGGKWTVNSAILIASNFGISETFIGLTIVALGTSLPELITSIVAAMRKSNGIAVGNVVGSNIFNVLWILGFTPLIKPIQIIKENYHDMLVVVISGLLIAIFPVLNKKRVLTGFKGIILLILYIGYIFYLTQRENLF